MGEVTDSRGDETTDRKRRRPARDRARKRAIRSKAVESGVAYLVAARHLDAGPEAPASRGRTLYPDSPDEHRRWLIALREQRSYDLRVRDTRQAIRLPSGRAGHVVERFPSMRTSVGRLYDGEARPTALAMLYATAIHERPDLAPGADELAWLAELGEQTSVDLACAALDRTARSLLDQDRWNLWTRVDAALTAGQHSPDPVVRGAARELHLELRSLAARSSMDGVRHTLDALRIASDGGHAPGTRVRILVRPCRGRTATIVGARWTAQGPPCGYDVRADGSATVLAVQPGDLTLLDPHRTSVPV